MPSPALKDKKTDNNAIFLEAWRDLEQAVRDDGKSIPDLEQELSGQNRESDASRLRINRQIRNFLVHDGQDFITATPAMTEFVKRMTLEFKTSKGTAGTAMITTAKYGCVTPGESIESAARTLIGKKRDSILILDANKTLLGALDDTAFTIALSKGLVGGVVQDLINQRCIIKNIQTISSDTPVPDIPDARCAVLDAKNRCVGVVNAEKAWR